VPHATLAHPVAKIFFSSLGSSFYKNAFRPLPEEDQERFENFSREHNNECDIRVSRICMALIPGGNQAHNNSLGACKYFRRTI
jgi:hypothetical protein